MGRRTIDEKTIHKKAVKLRHMTDEELVHYVEDRVEKARSEGFNEGKKAGAKNEKTVKQFLATIQLTNIQGIGAVTMSKLLKVADANGYLE